MPQLRVVSWNSNGETNLAKANLLGGVIIAVNQAHPQEPFRLILTQEAANQPGGGIYNMLNLLGADYNPVEHTTELPNGHGRGYNICTHVSLETREPPEPIDYLQDQPFLNWLNQFGTPLQNAIKDEIRDPGFRPPVWMEFGYEDPNGGFDEVIRVITWHAPRGLSTYCQGYTTWGHAPLDAFVFLSVSSLMDPTGIDVLIVAGDLNLTAADLATTRMNFEPLADFEGTSHRLDHILAFNCADPQTPVQCDDRWDWFGNHRDHDIMSCLLRW